MLGIRLDKSTAQRLEKLCNETGHSKSYYARKALIEFLNDREDYLLGIAALEKNESTLSVQKLEKFLALED